MIKISTLITLGLLFVQSIFSQGIGVNTTSPDRMLDVEDNSGNPQIRITYTSGTVYTEMTTNVLGDLGIIATNDRVGIGTNSPQNNLHVCSKSLGTSGDAIIKISSNIDDDNINDIPYLLFAKNANANAAVIGMEGNPGAHIAGSLTNSMILGTLTAFPVHIATGGSTKLTILATGEIGIGTNTPDSKLDIGDGAITLKEMTAPGAPVANNAVIFLEDNGSGKSRLMIRFSSGAAQQIAIQP